MSFINHLTKEINLKVVYYGPGLGGKTSNIQYIYQKTSGQNRGRFVSLNTKNERTLFFDFLPIDLGKVRGHRTRLHLYTVPGQSFYDASKHLVLRGVDGVIFVADSQMERMEANIQSFHDLRENLGAEGMSVERMPIALQWNKRDLPNISSIRELREKMNLGEGFPEFEAIATKGEGVFETLKSVSKSIILKMKGGGILGKK